jgi:uncharacterized membrane protein YozB (DUF420 family)
MSTADLPALNAALAAAIVPLAAVTLIRALRGRFKRHG